MPKKRGRPAASTGSVEANQASSEAETKPRKKYGCKYQDSWDFEFQGWIAKSEKGEQFAYCRICLKHFGIAHGGKHDIKKHTMAVNHIASLKSYVTSDKGTSHREHQKSRARLASRINHQELLSDPSHVIDLSLSLYQLQQQGSMCDCSIRAKQGSLDVHRLVLMASYSSYFHEELNKLPSTDGQPESSCISLRDQDLVDVQAVIQFMYTGEMYVSACNAIKVLALCRLLGLTDAESLCNTFIQKIIYGEEAQSRMESDLAKVNLPTYPLVHVTSTLQNASLTSIDHSNQENVTSTEAQNVPVSQIPTKTSDNWGGTNTSVSSPSSSMLGTMYIRSGTGKDEVEAIHIKINPLSDEDGNTSSVDRVDDSSDESSMDCDEESSKSATVVLDSSKESKTSTGRNTIRPGTKRSNNNVTESVKQEKKQRLASDSNSDSCMHSGYNIIEHSYHQKGTK